jgi:hypothetical protein
MRISYIKTAVWLLVILELWLLLQVPSVGDALFSFVVGGELPGTNKILTPQDMTLFSAGTFLLLVSLIFHKDINRLVSRLSRKRPQSQHVQGQVMTATPPTETPPKQASISAALSQLRHVVNSAYESLRPRVRTLGEQLRQAFRASKQKSVIAWQHLRKAIIWTIAMEVYIVYRAWTLAVALWRKARPYMERFDRWLNRRLHQNQQASDVLAFAHEAGATIKGWFVRLRSPLGK